jgi:hypothetical protein
LTVPPPSVLPNAILIGAERCGTTSLHNYLGRHPEIVMSRTKELRFFADRPDLESGPPLSAGVDRAIVAGLAGAWNRGIGWYRTQFDPSAPIRGESSPIYSNPWFGYCAERIAGQLPGAKLIFCVRDPVDRAVSHYRLLRAWGQDPRPIDDALSAPDGIYRSGSRYARRLDPYLEAFGMDRILVVDSAELDRRRRETLRAVYRFLGVEEAFWTEDLERRWHLSERQSGAAWYAIRRLRRIPGWQRVTSLPPKRALWPIERLTGRSSPRRARPELAPEVRERLAASLSEDAERLRAITGRAFPSWSI